MRFSDIITKRFIVTTLSESNMAAINLTKIRKYEHQCSIKDRKYYRIKKSVFNIDMKNHPSYVCLEV